MSADGPELEVVTHEQSPSLRRVEVSVPAARVRQAYDRAYDDLGKSARIKGFRPGKVPRSVLERLYAASLGEEIERRLVNETLPAALSQADVEPVAAPSVDATPPVAGEAFCYTALVEVRPPIELPELEGLPGKRPLVLVGDDEIQRELEQLQQRNAPQVEEPEGCAAENGHFLSVDFVGRVDGEAFEGGTGRDVEIELGAGRFIPGFEEQLVGVRAGEDREIEVDFPDDYGAPDLAGKRATFATHVAAVKRRDLPELDDEFAKDLGEFDTIDALRDRIHSDLQETRERSANSELRRSLLDALVERSEFEVPAGVVDQQLERRLRMAVQQLQGGVPDDELRAQVERWREEWRPAAEREVRERWLLDAVADAREITIEDAAVAERLEQLAASQGVDLAALAEEHGIEAMQASMRSDLQRERALDFLAATAKVEEVTET